MSLLLVAAGAVLIWAVNATVSGVDLIAIGWVLFIVGIVGIALSMIFWSSWGGYGMAGGGPRRRYVEEDVPPRY